MSTQRSLTTWTPSIHPFAPDGSIDEAGFRRHLDRLAGAGVHALVANEGTGESHTFTDAEMRQVLEIAGDHLRGRSPVWGMGRMVRTADQMVEFVRMVESAGLDGVQIYTVEFGHGMAPTVAEQEEYLSSVLRTVNIPALLSLNMVAGFQYPVELVAKVVNDFPVVQGLIVNTASVAYLGRILDAVGDRVDVLVSPPHILAGVAMGAAGLAAPEANIAPHTCVAFMRACATGDQATAHDLYRVLMRLGRLTEDFGKSALKAAADALGHPGGDPRLPRLPLSRTQRDGVVHALEKLDIARLEAHHAAANDEAGRG